MKKYSVVNPSGDWSRWLPPFEPQSSKNGASDSLGCVSFSAVHCIETQQYFRTGILPDYSERALAELSGTSLYGNSVDNIIASIKKDGLIFQNLWPDLDTFTWNEFYAPIPKSIVATGQDFLRNYAVEKIYVSADEVDDALKQAPIWLEISYPLTNHFVMQFSKTQYFDTYQPSIKNVGDRPIVQRFQILLTQKTGVNAMYQLVLKQDGKTYGVRIATPNGDQIIYATTEEQYRSWAKVDSYQLPTVKPDGSTDWNPTGIVNLPF